MIEETEWRCTQDLYASGGVKAGGFKRTTNSLKSFLFIVDAEEQLETWA